MADSRESIAQRILDLRASAIVRTKEQQLAADAMRAAVRGGFRLVEFTLTTPGVFELIADFSREADLLVGAGTVHSPADVERAAKAGAKFIVSAIFDPQVIAAAHACGLPAMPGCATPTEMWSAHRAGADFCKLFPGPAEMPTWLRSVLAPLPMLRIFPTNGVTVQNARAILDAGACAVGFTLSLFEPVWMAARDFGAVEARAKEILGAVR